MKRAVFILIVLLFCLLYYQGVLTKADTFPLSKEFFSPETSFTEGHPLDLRELWLSKLKSPNQKTSPITPKELEPLYQLQLDKGIKNFPLLSSLLLREAGQAGERGQADQAKGLVDYAIKFSPDLPQPYFGMVKALWREDPFQVGKILPLFIEGQMAHFRHFPSSLRVFYNALYIGSNALLMAFLIFGLVVMLKYLPLYFYDIQKNLTQEISMVIVNWFKILILFIPFFLGLDILWSILFWSILLWGFITKQERRFLLLFLIVLVYIPFLLRSTSNFLDGPSFALLQDLNKANNEDWDRRIEKELQAYLVNHPEDSDVLLTLGLLEKRQGRYSQAEDFYQKAIQSQPKFSEAYANLGNVYLARKQASQAISSYQQAIEIDPGHGAYYFNLYRAYSQETFLSGQTDKAFQRARQLSPKLIEHYSAIDSPNPNRFIIDEVLSTPVLWERALDQFLGKEGPLFPLFKAWFEKIPSRTPYLIPLFFLGFLIAISKYGRAKRFLARCPMCGSPTYRFYLGDTDQDFICFNCHRIFVQKEKLHPRITEKKSFQVKQFQRENHFVGRFLSFFFAGFGDLWGDRPFRGLAFLFLFFIFVLRFVYWKGVLSSPVSPSSPVPWGLVLWGIFFILFYLFSLQRIQKMKPRFQMER